MPKQLVIGKDANGATSFDTAAPDYITNYVLVASTAQTVTVPTGAKIVKFGATGDFYVRWVGTPAAVPGANVTDGTGAEINPTGRNLDGLTSFSVVAPANCVISATWYF